MRKIHNSIKSKQKLTKTIIRAGMQLNSLKEGNGAFEN